MAKVIMREVEFDQKYVSDEGHLVLERSFDKLVVDEDGDELQTSGEWMLYSCDPANQSSREAWAVNGMRNNIAARHNLELIEMERE